MKPKKNLIILSTILLLTSCNNGQQNKTILNRVNFDNGLFSFVAQHPNEKPSLFTIDYYPDDNICLINEATFTYVNEESMEIVEQEPIIPLKIFEFTDRYIFLAYSETPSEQNDKLNYIMDRKTGECFLFPANSVPLFKYGNHDVSNNYYIGNFQTDKNGYIYYVANEYTDDKSTLYHPLNRIDLTNPNNIKITKVSHNFDSVYDAYAITQDGDVAYRYKDNDNIKVAYVHHDGTYYQHDSLNISKNLFSGFNNHIYALVPNSDHVDIAYFDYSTKTLNNVATYQGNNCDFEEIFYIKDYSYAGDKKTDIVAGLYSDGLQTLYINNMTGNLKCSTFSSKDSKGTYSLLKDDRRPFFSFDDRWVILTGRDKALEWPWHYAFTPFPDDRYAEENSIQAGDKELDIEKFFATSSTHNADTFTGAMTISIYFMDTSDGDKKIFDIYMQGQMFDYEFVKDDNWSVVAL